MALIKPEQLRSGLYQISGSFSGSFAGDGSALSNITASLAPNYTLTSSFNAFTSSYVQDSSSFDTRILNNSGSIDILSSSFETFSGSYVIDSSSFDTRILANSSSIDILSGSFETFTQTYNTGSFTGSFIGDGNGLFNIPASGIVGLNLSQIVSGSVSASISPDSGLQINTNVTATSFTGSLSGTASFAQTASYVETAQTASYVLQAVSSSFASSGTGEFTGSFSGSFVGDGSQLTGIVSSSYAATASFVPEGVGGIYGGNGTVPLNTTASINGDFTFLGLDEDTRLIVRDGNNGGQVHLFSDGNAGQAALEFYNPAGDILLHRIQQAGGDTRYVSNNRDLVFSTSTGSLSSGIFITASNGDVGIGTITPNYKLDVGGSTNIDGNTTITGSLIVTTSVTASSYTGSFVGDGSQLTGIVSSKWSGSNPISRDSDVEITGSLFITGDISSFSLTGSDNRIVLADPQGTLEASNQTLIEAYINPTSSAALLLDDTLNWSIYGIYSGSVITGTVQGQRHYNIDYYFEAVDDNDWIRLIRG